MSLGSFIKNATAVVKGIIGDTSDKIAQDNPEYVLNEAILKAKDNIAETEEKVANLITIQRKTEQETEQMKEKLCKIQSRIGMAQRDGEKEAVIELTSYYKETEKELEDLLNTKKEIDDGVKELKEFILNSEKEIKKLEREKNKLLVQLQTAKTKEEIMNIKSSFKKDTSYQSEFNRVKEQINKKVENVKSKEELNRYKTNSNPKSKYFDGI